MTQPIRKLAVIGAGQAGRRFALKAAQAGFDVILEDVMPANLRRAEADFSDLSGQVKTGSMAFALTVEDAVREADLAIDFVPDELESKLEIFCLLDRMAPPKTILCTPAETLSITDLASCTYRPDRCLALRGNDTLLHPPAISPEALTATQNFFIALDRDISTHPDPEAPMLMKNIRPA